LASGGCGKVTFAAAATTGQAAMSPAIDVPVVTGFRILPPRQT
jgi:hypothetical protein